MTAIAPPAQGNVSIQDATTSTYVQRVDAGGNALFTDGGLQTTAVAAGTSTDTVIKATAGRLCKVLITTAGTNALVIWDNASGHTGTIIGSIAASAAAGTLVSFQMPAANGITVQGNSNNPAFTVSWS
jgi:hypothetical protein